MLQRAGDRFRTDTEGIVSWHCFSAGPHHDPANIAFGTLVGLDEHHVAPGHGFDWHGHRGVDIVSWVLAGRLRHEGHDVLDVEPGAALVQHTGGGVRHRETNPSGDEALVLLQATLLAADGRPAARITPVPVRLVGGTMRVLTGAGACAAPAVVFVAAGRWRADGCDLGPGDSVRSTHRLRLSGAGAAVVWELAGAPGDTDSPAGQT